MLSFTAWSALILGWLLIYLGRGPIGVLCIALFAVLRVMNYEKQSSTLNPLAALLIAFGRYVAIGFRFFLYTRKSATVRSRHELPDDFDPNLLHGKSLQAVRKFLGPSTLSIMMEEGIRALSWENYKPKIYAYFKDEICIKVGEDRNWHLKAVSETELLEQFSNSDWFIGLTIFEIESVVGTCSSYGSFDHGIEVYDWKCGKAYVQAWFRESRCDEIEIT